MQTMSQGCMESMIDEKTMSFKKKVVIKFAILLLIHVIGLLIFLQHALAQTASTSPFNLGVSPPTAYLRVKPGESALHTIILTNAGEQPISLIPELVSFRPDGLTGNPVLLEQLEFPYLDTARTPTTPIILQPEQQYQFPIHIIVPGDAQEAEHTLTVLFRREADASLGSTSAVGGVIGSNLIVLVSGTEQIPAQFEVADWQTPRLIDSLGTLRAAPIITNNSFAAQVASGSAAIVGPFGNTVADQTMFSEVVLGESSRQLRWIHTPSTPTEPAELSEYIQHKQPFFFGPYTLLLEMAINVDGSIQYQTLEYRFFAIPFSLLISIGFIVGVAFMYKKYYHE